MDDIIKAIQHITINKIADKLGIGHVQAHQIIHNVLQYQKVSAGWVPRQLITKHMEQWSVSLGHLVHCHHDDNEFLF